MAYTLYRQAIFGSSKGGLSTVGYTLGTNPRVTAGVAEVVAGSGTYAASISVPDGFRGPIVWDTGDSPIARAFGSINPGSDEYTDAKTSSIATPTLSIAADGLDAVLDAPNAIGAKSLRAALRAVAAILVGKMSQTQNSSGTSASAVFRDLGDDATVRVTATSTKTSRDVSLED